MADLLTEEDLFGAEPPPPTRPAKERKPNAPKGGGVPGKSVSSGYEGPKSKPQAAPPGKAEAFGRGAVQGASAGTADELTGIIKAIRPTDPGDRFRYGRDLKPPVSSESLKQAEEIRDKERAGNRAAKEAEPGFYTGGQVFGGVAAGATVGAPTTLAGTIGAGAAYGALTGAGESEATTAAGVAKDAAIAGGIGAAGGAIGHGATKLAGAAKHGVQRLVGALPDSVPGAKRAAEAIARRGARKLSEETTERIGGVNGPLSKETLTRLEGAEALEKKWAGMLGDKKAQFFSAAEASGDPALALTESKARQMGGPVGSAAQAERKSRLKNTAKVFDLYAKEISGNPERLGKAEVADQFGSVVQRHADELRELRSGVAAQMADEVNRIAGNQRIVPMRDTANTINVLIEELRSPLATSPDKGLIKELEGLGQKMVEAADDGAPGNARFRMREIQNALASWGKKASSGEGVANEAGRGTQRMVASRIFGALNRDLDNAASQEATGQLGAAGQALVRFRQAYREMSQDIEAVNTEAIQKITGLAGGEAAESMTDRLLSMNSSQLAGVFRVADKVDPGVADQMRAEMFQTLLERAGKPRPTAQELSDLGVTQLQPKTALNLLNKHWEKLQAAYAGHPKAKLALKEITEGLRNLATGPGLEGSPTAPLLAETARDIAGSAVKRAADIVTPGGGSAVQEIGKAVAKITRSEQAAMRAVSTPEGIQAYRDALKLQLAAQKGSKIDERIAGSTLAAFKRLGLLTEEQITGPQQPAPSPVRRGSS